MDEVCLARTVHAQGADYHVIRWIQGSAFEGARRAAWLRHPNLITIRELGDDGGRWFVAMEYIHGEELRRVLARVRRTDDLVPIALATAIGAAAAAGLHHAHTHQGSRRARHGSIHGALSPSSIVIGYDGSVKIVDLGVATPIEASYLAPEQVSGGQGQIDRRTDVFALGILLYELATARRLFAMPTDFLTQAAIVHACIPPPSRFRRGLPRALEAIIMKALAPAPANRFKSAGELGAALEEFARGLGMRQSPEGIADYLKQLCGTRPFPWTSSAEARSPRAMRSQITEELEPYRGDDQPGVAAPPEAVLRELGVPEARELEVTPGRGTKTPMAWMSQTVQPPPWSRRRIGTILASAAITAAVAGFVIVGALVQGGGAGEVAPASAPLPSPPPASPVPASPVPGPAAPRALAPEAAPAAPEPPPPARVLPAVPDASVGGGSGSAPAASDPEPAVKPTAKPRMKRTPKPVARAIAKPAAKPVAKPAAKPVARTAAKPAVTRPGPQQAPPTLRAATAAARPARTR
jgi:serine/threonine-protein kinase